MTEKPSKATELVFSVAVNLRPFTNPRVEDRVLAFYAHQIVFLLLNRPDVNFWTLAKKAYKLYHEALKKYELVDANDHDTLNTLKKMTSEAIENQQSFIPCTLSNVGVVDSAFQNTGRFSVDEFFFTVQDQLLFSCIIFAATIKDRLCLNFNYCTPVISDKTIQKIVDGTMQRLLLAATTT